MTEPFPSIPTTPAGKPLDTSSEPPKANNPDELTPAEKLEALRKANEERKKKAEAEDKEAEKLETLRNPDPLHDARVDVTSGKREDERAAKPRAMRAIMENGNVLKTIDWPWKRDPSEKEKDDFLRSVKHAVTVDIVNAIG